MPALVAALVTVHQLTRPNVLTGVHAYDGSGYDDGVYFSAALRLVHGVIPYADFRHLHPTGLTVLLAPVALLDHVMSQQWAFAVARCLMVLVTAASAALAAQLLRHRGVAAALTAGLAVAAHPTIVSSTHSVMLEPYLVLGCLLGAALLFDGDEVADERRVLWSGVVFGVAAAVKLWAVVVIAPTLVLLIVVARHKAPRYLTGTVLGFAIPVLPLALTAPVGFVRQVVLAQIGRGTNGVADFSVGDRFSMLWGFEFWPDGRHGETALLVLVGLAALWCAVLALQMLAGHRLFPPMAAWCTATAAVLLLAMHAPRQFYDHYVGFIAPFVAVLAGLTVGSVTRLAAEWAHPAVHRWALPGIACALTMAVLPITLSRSSDYLAGADRPGDVIAAVIPHGACVVAAMPTQLVVADRLPTDNDCPAVNDPFGLWLTDNDGRPTGSPPPFDEAFRARWLSWFQRADYVVLTIRRSSYIPWDDAMGAWFDANYRLVAEQGRVLVYQRTG